jgi:CRISPR-associated protein Cmx8
MSLISKDGNTITLAYDLFTLPTAQHKAGLAGLVLMIDSLKERRIEPRPTLAKLSPGGASIILSKNSLQTLFDDLYDAYWEEVSSKQKWKDKQLKRIDEVEVSFEGEVKKEKRFVYDMVRPKGVFLQNFYPDGNGLWVKLWRDMLWGTLRGIPKTRDIYEKRADGKSYSLPGEVWKNLEKAHDQQKKGGIRTEGFASSLFIGAEDASAEKVPFLGPVADNLLLHFWPIASLIHVPRTWTLKRTREQGFKVERKEAGFVLSIPEPADLESFCQDARSVLIGLDVESGGIRPRSALIDVHEEGGLECLYHFAHRKTLEQDDYALSLCALELYHLQKEGNRIRQLAATRIIPQKEVLADYELIRKKYWNPFFKAVVLRNIIDGSPWHTHFDAPLHQHPMPVFIRCQGRTPIEMTFFGSDVKRKFKDLATQLESDMKGGIMDEQTRENQLAMRIYRLIQTYVNVRTEEKSSRRYQDISKQKDADGRISYPREYREAREKVCSDAFLAMRGRRDQEFIEYFTGTICSVPQYLKQEEYVNVAGVLMSDWEKVKTLAMLALSAHSYLPGSNEQKEVE